MVFSPGLWRPRARERLVPNYPQLRYDDHRRCVNPEKLRCIEKTRDQQADFRILTGCSPTLRRNPVIENSVISQMKGPRHPKTLRASGVRFTTYQMDTNHLS